MAMAMEVRRRIQREVQALMETHVVEPGEDLRSYYVLLHGPNESLYGGGYFRIEVVFNDDYPRKPPVITFHNRILHPNISLDGDVCISLLGNELWDSRFTLNDIFDLFIPTVLCEPNFDDPLNQEASQLHERSVFLYEEAVRDWVQVHASREVAEFFVLWQPEQPAEEPEQPAEQPAEEDEQPEQPAEEAEQPAEEDEQPEQPAEEAEQPDELEGNKRQRDEDEDDEDEEASKRRRLNEGSSSRQACAPPGGWCTIL